MRSIQRDIVSALIFSKDGKLLMGMKDPHGGGVYADCWHIPGGGIDEGEDKLTALRREVREEVGIDIGSAAVNLVDDQGSGQSEKILKDTGEKVLCKMIFNVYRVDLPQLAANVKLGPHDDLVKLAWVSPRSLVGYKLTPPSILLFKRPGFL
jgi:8-oxo-dGTP pyrophosphatase MutT (NUDIX family)